MLWLFTLTLQLGFNLRTMWWLSNFTSIATTMLWLCNDRWRYVNDMGG